MIRGIMTTTRVATFISSSARRPGLGTVGHTFLLTAVNSLAHTKVNPRSGCVRRRDPVCVELAPSQSWRLLEPLHNFARIDFAVGSRLYWHILIVSNEEVDNYFFSSVRGVLNKPVLVL